MAGNPVPGEQMAGLDELWPATSLAAWQRAPQQTFLDWLAHRSVVAAGPARQFRRTSISTYVSMFHTWLEFLGERRLHLLEARARDATEFFEQHALEPVSRRRYLQLLDKVYRQLQHIGWTGLNPLMHELARERELEPAMPAGLDEEEQDSLVAVLAKLPDWKGVRDRGLCALLLGAGLRTNEAVHLPLGAVGDDFRIRIVPAGVHRPHTSVMLPEGPWREWWLAWLDARARSSVPGTLACPSTRKGRAYCASGLWRRVSQWFELAKLQPEQRGAHILRNTFARNALAGGRYGITEVQEFLGHEAERATARLVGEALRTVPPPGPANQVELGL